MLQLYVLTEPVNAAYFAIIVSAFAAGLLKGTPDERVAAVSVLPMLATLLIVYPYKFYPSMVAVETLALVAGFWWVALRRGHNWAIFGAAFSFNALLFTLPMILGVAGPAMHDVVSTLVGFWQIAAMLTLTGTVLSRSVAVRGGAAGEVGSLKGAPASPA